MATLKVEYTTSSEQTYTVLWTTPALFLSFPGLYPTTEIEDVEKSNYKLKMEFSQRHEVKIYYLSRVTIDVKVEISILKPLQSQADFRNEYSVVQAHTWQYLTSFNPKNNCEDVVVRFKFTTKDKNSVLQEKLKDNESLLQDELFSDATIKSVDGVEYKVHKVILATRSSVFKAHLTHNTIESITNVIDSQFESEVLIKVLNFIYTNRLPKIDEVPEKLLAAADFYQLDILKKHCEMVLCKNLKVENVIENLQLAELYSMEDLKKGILGFIMDDKRAHGITKTEAWNELTSVTLIKFLYENVTKNL